MTARYEIKEHPNVGFSVLRITGDRVQWVELNITTREKAEAAADLWRQREKDGSIDEYRT
jgi:hypothetical protein